MLTKAALEGNDNKHAGNERNGDIGEEFGTSARDRTKEGALRVYNSELELPTHMDLGLHGVTRASLRMLCKEAVLESSSTVKRKYSYSALSSAIPEQEGNDSSSALRLLQKERLIVSRLGFPDRAMEIDKEIDLMREKVRIVREKEEKELFEYRLKMLRQSQQRKSNQLEMKLSEETRQMEDFVAQETEKCRKRQKEEFLRVLEGASRRAIGRVKKCNCAEPYLCRHNKTASYNTRRPTKIVVQYRRNGKRLRHSGRAEEGEAWEEKAKEIDEQHQEIWRDHVANSIVASPWGANEAVVDQLTESHKKELMVLEKTHIVKRDVNKADCEIHRRNFQNTCEAEGRKVKMQCRKQALLRSQADTAEAAKEAKRAEKLSYKSDGLKNISKNLLGGGFDEEDRKAIDWVAPTAFGMDNSQRLLDAYKDVASGESVINMNNRVMKSRADLRNAKVDEEDEDSDDDDDDDPENQYKYGTTSGSKLVDKMRRKEEKERLARLKLAAKKLQNSDDDDGDIDEPGSSASPSPKSPVSISLAPPSAWGGSSMGGFGSSSDFGASSPAASATAFGTPGSPVGSGIGSFTPTGSGFGSGFGSPMGGGFGKGGGFGSPVASGSAGGFGGFATPSSNSSVPVSTPDVGMAISPATSMPAKTPLFNTRIPVEPLKPVEPPNSLSGSTFGSASPTGSVTNKSTLFPGKSDEINTTPIANSNTTFIQKPTITTSIITPSTINPETSSMISPTAPTSPHPSSAFTSPHRKINGDKPIKNDDKIDIKNAEPIDDDDNSDHLSQNENEHEPDYNPDDDSDISSKENEEQILIKSSKNDDRKYVSVKEENEKIEKNKAIQKNLNLASKKLKTNKYVSLPPDWIFDSDDELEPRYKPGSVLDEDWKDHEANLGAGMENSYGVPLIPEAMTSKNHQPDLKAIPLKSAIRRDNSSSSKESTQRNNDKEKKKYDTKITFGDVAIREYVVESDHEEEEVTALDNDNDEKIDIKMKVKDVDGIKKVKKLKFNKDLIDPNKYPNLKIKINDNSNVSKNKPVLNISNEGNNTNDNDDEGNQSIPKNNEVKNLNVDFNLLSLKPKIAIKYESEESGDDDIVKYEKRLQNEVKHLRQQLEEKMSQSSGSTSPQGSLKGFGGKIPVESFERKVQLEKGEKSAQLDDINKRYNDENNKVSIVDNNIGDSEYENDFENDSPVKKSQVVDKSNGKNIDLSLSKHIDIVPSGSAISIIAATEDESDDEDEDED